MSQPKSITANAFRVMDEAELDRVNGGDAPPSSSNLIPGINLDAIRTAIAVVIASLPK